MSNIMTIDNSALERMMNAVTISANTVTTLVQSVSQLGTNVAALTDDMKEVKDDINYLKNTAEIGYEQRRMIREAVKRRVYTVLDIPMKKEDRSENDKIACVKYSSMFFNRCYSETSKLGHLGTPYGMTTKENYTSALKDIDAWWPADGVDALKEEAEENIRIRKKARES